jgi:hypothetical protein
VGAGVESAARQLLGVEVIVSSAMALTRFWCSTARLCSARRQHPASDEHRRLFHVGLCGRQGDVEIRSGDCRHRPCGPARSHCARVDG